MAGTSLGAGSPNLSTDLTGLVKTVYADNYLDAVPPAVKLLPMVPFDNRSRMGDNYVQMIIMADEGGFTYAGQNTGPVDLVGQASIQTQKITVTAWQLILRASVDYEAAAKSQTDKQAFEDAIGLKMKNMIVSAKKRLECSLIYGQSGLGKISSIASGTSATQAVITVTAATHAPLIWQGKKGHQVVVYSGTFPTADAGAAAPFDNSDGSTQVTFAVFSVNVADATRTVTVTGSSANILSLMNTGSAGGNFHLFWNTTVQGSGATFVNQDMLGLDGQVTQTSGSKFGIETSVYDLWRGNSYDNGGGILNTKTLLDAAAVGVNRGLEGDAVLFCHPRAWENLNNSQAALRVFDKSYDPKKNQIGTRAIEYFYQAGKISVIGHGMIKAGEAFLVPEKELVRVGATDITLNYPGWGGQIFIPSPTTTGLEWRLFSDQALLLQAPAKSVKITNIVNS